MPIFVPLLVGGAVATGTAAAIGTAIAGAAVSTAVATGIGAAVVGTGAALATGQKPSGALKTGVVSGLTAGVGSSIGSAVAGAGAVTDAAFVAADAAQLAAQGLNQAAITQNLLATGVSQATAQTAATMALSGAAESAIANQLGSGSLFNNAPIETRNLADYPSATETAYPAVPVEQTYTPAPGSFQEALPGFGVETQASQAPFTAVPGSFAAATAPAATAAGYGLLSQPPSTISIQDALRTAQTANRLLNPPEQPGMPMDQGGGMRAQGVDYSGLLGLLQARAGTPRVSGLLGPAQIRYPSLLG
jgi:hypothetical protein